MPVEPTDLAADSSEASSAAARDPAEVTSTALVEGLAAGLCSREAQAAAPAAAILLA